MYRTVISQNYSDPAHKMIDNNRYGKGIHSGLLEFSTGSTIIWHAFAHFPHFIHLSLSTLYLYRETGLKME